LDLEKQRRSERAKSYEADLEVAGLPSVEDSESFASNRRRAEERLQPTEEDAAALRQRQIDLGIELKGLAEQRAEISTEVEALRRRKSNIPAEYQRIRSALCEELGVTE